MQPLVSVLICAYNVEKYFAQSLAAVVNQTWRNLDILIVDDGSTDGTLAIAKDFQKRDSRIKILAQAQNSGLIPSLNIGLDELAKSGGGGDFLLFLINISEPRRIGGIPFASFCLKKKK
ncbi:glycosyltransferase family 2 protein, partial [Neisseria gonorrhoeae]|uniref:glycosyltransferase family 2 protein n=1 Tax=Neisseria gonorrhoeae TaxID=485 RepID=UPI002041CE23